MLRGIEKIADSPLFSSTLSTTSVSVRRLQRPGPASAPTRRMSRRPSARGPGRGVGAGVGGTDGGATEPGTAATAVGATLADGEAVAAGRSPKPSSSSSDDAKTASTVSRTARTSAPTTICIAAVAARSAASTKIEMFERGTPGRAFHHASTMASERQTKSTASATTMPSRTVGWSMNPMAAPESPRATDDRGDGGDEDRHEEDRPDDSTAGQELTGAGDEERKERREAP